MKKRVTKKFVDFVARSILASLLLIWGTANLVANVVEALTGNFGPQWAVSIPLVVLFGLIPIGVAIWLISGLLRNQR